MRNVTITWPQSLTEPEMLQLIDLMNTVAVRETSMGYSEPIGREFGLAIMRGIDEELKAGKSHLLLVTATDGRLVGMLTLAMNSLPNRAHILEMKRCVIHPEERGRFLLKAWDDAVQKCQELGVEMIVIDVRENTKGYQLWKRLGFREYGRLHDYARVGDRKITGIFMHMYVKDALARKQATGSYMPREAAAPSEDEPAVTVAQTAEPPHPSNM